MKRPLLVILSLLLLLGGVWFYGASDVMHELLRFPIWGLVGITTLFALNLIVVSFRLFRVLAHFGLHLPWRMAWKASVSGYVAGLFVISLFGQVIGRHIVLKKFGVGPVLIASLSAYERFSLLLISGLLCIWGSASVFHFSLVTQFLEGSSLVEISLASIVAFLINFFVARSKFEGDLLKRVCSFSNLRRFVEIAGITLIAQLFVLGAFVVGVLALQPDTNLFQLFAAAAVISFAASLPISVNGWGVREIAAVYTLTPLGINSSSAMAVSISVGLCSTLVVFLAAPFALKKESAPLISVDQDEAQNVMPQTAAIPEKREVEKAATWVIATASAILIFFQIHVPLEGGVISLNLADPFAILALAAAVVHLISAKSLPAWNVRYFNGILMVLSGLLLFAFLNGLQTIGVTQWAFAGRLLGWCVILGYISVGFLLVNYFGRQGCRRFVEAMLITAAIVVFVQIFLRWAIPFGWFENVVISYNFEGYAGNRNSFALQMLVASILFMIYSAIYVRAHKQIIFFGFLHSFILAGLFFSASRAGLIVGAILIIFCWVMKWADRKALLLSLLFAGVVWALPQLELPQMEVAHSVQVKRPAIQSGFSYEGSNTERLESIQHGVEMWRDNPIVGAGLGVFYARSGEWFDHPLVIHSTPIWMLAEFGLFGALIFGGAFVVISYQQVLTRRKIASRIVLLLLGGFVIFGAAHDIFYQRIFWLALGIFLSAKLPESRKEVVPNA